MKDALAGLRARGVSNLALELPVDAQDSFARKIDESRESALIGGAIWAGNGTKLDGIDGLLDLALHAKNLGMGIHCVDAKRSPDGAEVRGIQKLDDKLNRGKISEGGYVRGVQEQFSRRNAHMANEISKLPGDTVLVAGMFHTGGKGSVEEHLRMRGMDAVSVDVYPKGRNATVDVFERNESPSADLKIKSASKGVCAADIESMISRLRGGAGDGRSFNDQIGALQRGSAVAERTRERNSWVR